MTRWKTHGVLLLSALVVVLGGFLPRLVSAVLDRFDADRVSYEQISGVHLEFDSSGMTLREKLALLSSATGTMQVSPDMAKHTSAQIWQIAMATAERYREAGLIPRELAASNIAYCVPSMVYWEKQGSTEQLHSNVFWELSIADGTGGDNALTMTIDDRTGTVCTLSYQNVTTHRQQNTRLDQDLETLCTLALTELGEEFAQFDPGALADAAGVDWNTASYGAADIAWEDPVYGEVRLAFVVSEAGFYTYTY